MLSLLKEGLFVLDLMKEKRTIYDDSGVQLPKCDIQVVARAITRKGVSFVCDAEAALLAKLKRIRSS
jgi:hypothetical protein